MPFHSSELLSWQRGARKGAELFLSFENLGFPSRTEPLPFHSVPRDKRGAVARGRCSRQGNTPRDTGDSSQELLASLAEAQGKQTEHVTSSWARRLLRDAEAGWEPGFVWMCIQGVLCHAPGPGGGTSRAGSSTGSGLLSTQNSSRGRNFAAIPSSSSGFPAARSKGSGRTSVLLPAAAPGLEGGVGPEGGAGSPSRLQAAAERCSRSVEFQAPWKTGSRQAPRATLPRPLTPAASTSSLQLNPPKPRDNNEPQLPPRPTAPRGRAGHGQARAG